MVFFYYLCKKKGFYDFFIWTWIKLLLSIITWCNARHIIRLNSKRIPKYFNSKQKPVWRIWIETNGYITQHNSLATLYTMSKCKGFFSMTFSHYTSPTCALSLCPSISSLWSSSYRLWCRRFSDEDLLRCCSSESTEERDKSLVVDNWYSK